MNEFITQEYLYFIGPILVLSLALASVAVSYVFLLIRLSKSEKDKIFLQSKIRDQASEILREAHEKKIKLIQEAITKAGNILKETDVFSSDIKSVIKAEIDQIRQRQEKLFVELNQEAGNLYKEQFRNTAKNMEQAAMGNLKDLNELLTSEKIELNKEFSLKIEEYYKKYQKELEDYKVNQISKIDKQVFDVLHVLAKEVLGKSLSIKDHEELVQKALSKIKTDLDSQVF